ncbi:hypothetical protein [Enhygromyxa salina]|uniref:Uncharacterized protein n=1 Tax=Enhygromyxa salina TaxID=215803 RepID=A0A2S9XL06_9BACT|nr:hypothetical protein [Enhygromyxa salina]PRP93545.1 hypothetical protein ENSA7_79730 [Enhygromyxa salina]
MGRPLARAQARARQPLRFELPLAPERVIAELLADPRVAEARLSTLGAVRGASTRFVLERAEQGFVLAGRASEPGVWEPGAYAVLDGRITHRKGGGSELTLRFRLHPLTRAAYLSVASIALLIIPLQFWTTGLLLGTAMMFPIVLAAMVVGLDSGRLGDQRASLQRLVEEVFAPLALAREPGERCPFRRDAECRPNVLISRS